MTNPESQAEREELPMNAYFYSFDFTGIVEIDRVLSAVAVAGKGAHSTEDWCEYGFDRAIQEAADSAAAAWIRNRSAALPPVAAVPDGWKLVPIEPSEAMVSVNQSMLHPLIAAAIWKEMIAAAPKPPEA